MGGKMSVREQAEAARAASRRLAAISAGVKNTALTAMAEALTDGAPEILEANTRDWENARERGTKAAFLDRLRLDEGRLAVMAEGLRQTAALPDPIGEGLSATVRPNGLEIRQVRVPLGVVGIVYEARPNVTADAAALCLKTGNAAILRGGSKRRSLARRLGSISLKPSDRVAAF